MGLACNDHGLLFGTSYVYILFEDGTDIYWARSRVLEYLNQVQGNLPAEARTALGPDATGVGWVYNYALGAFVIMYFQGLNANIMSLGGIAVAIGSMIDGSIVMIENFHKHMQRVKDTAANRWAVVRQSSLEVGPPLFFSLLIEAISFMPVFSLQAQEGRMFSPLAFTKSYAMVVAAGLTITLVPVLVGYLVRGQIRDEQKNPVNRWMMWAYRPLVKLAPGRPKTLLTVALVILVLALSFIEKAGSQLIF